MSPEEKVRFLILAKAGEWNEIYKTAPDITPEALSTLWDMMVDNEDHWDAISETREGEFETGLSCETSRHYESKSVAAKLPDGSWVGWTYWYGGGKHGEPEGVDWIEYAYDLTCAEEKKVVTVRTFEKVA